MDHNVSQAMDYLNKLDSKKEPVVKACDVCGYEFKPMYFNDSTCQGCQILMNDPTLKNYYKPIKK